MVQKSTGAAQKQRGRPRAYDPDTALQKALDVFWIRGYSGTSLDDISAATGMNRPSLYAAFGDKRELYLKALNYYFENYASAIREILLSELPLNQALMQIYEKSLEIYYANQTGPRGCFALSTATAEAIEDLDIRAALGNSDRRLDRAFEIRIRKAYEKGELKNDADPATLALLASATLHSIAIRSRSGASCDAMRDMARRAVALICGQEGLRQPARP